MPTLTGTGFLAGEDPGGLTTAAHLPVMATVKAFYEEANGDWTLAGEAASALDGTWIIEDLNHELPFHVVGIHSDYRGVVATGVMPVRTDVIVCANYLAPNEEGNGVEGYISVDSGVPPFTVSVIDPLPYGLTPAIHGRILTIEGVSGDAGQWESTVRVTDSNGVWGDVSVEVEIQESGDPYWEQVALLLHMEGANDSTTFVDSSPRPKTVTTHGNAQISTVRSRFGGSSMLLDGNGDYLSFPASADAGFGSGDWTVEGWFYPSGAQVGNRFLLDMRVATGSSFMVWCSQTNATNRIGFSNEVGTGFVSGGGWTANAFNHWAVTRKAGTVRGFINGVLAFTTTDARTYASSQGAYVSSSTAPGQGALGYMDEVRITKGVARYTDNFTPPTEAFANY